MDGTEDDPLCVASVELFCSLYGAEAANLALKCVAVGGIYVGGNPWDEPNETWSAAEKAELADYMIARWQAFKAAPTLTNTLVNE